MEKEIPRSEWRAELDNFSRQHEGENVRVAISGPDGRTHTEARDLPLQGISADSPDAKRIDIAAGQSPSVHITHEVSNPVSVAIDRSDGGADRRLRIRGADGTTATVEFDRGEAREFTSRL